MGQRGRSGLIRDRMKRTTRAVRSSEKSSPSRSPMLSLHRPPVPSERNPGVRPVNLAFSTLELRTVCENQVAAERAYGIEVARDLRARLADLQDAENVRELLAGEP